MVTSTTSAIIIDPFAPGGPSVVAELPGSGNSSGISYSPDGSLYATIGNGDIQIWDMAYNPVSSFPYNIATRPMVSMDWLEDGLVIVYADSTTRKFDVANPANPPIVFDIRLSIWKPDGTRAVRVPRAGIRIYDGNTGDFLLGLNADGTPYIPCQ